LLKIYISTYYICTAINLARQYMTIRSNSIFLLFLLLPMVVFSKGNTTDKADQSAKGRYLQDIQYLCMNTLEGRQTGTEGEKMAADFIQTRFEGIGLLPYKGKYQWDFTLQGGTVLGKDAYVAFNDQRLQIGSEIQFLPYSYGNEFHGATMPGVDEPGNVWLVPLSKALVQRTNTPHKILYEYTRSLMEHQPTAIVYFNDMGASADITLAGSSKFDALTLPVAIVNHAAAQKFIRGNLLRDWIYVDAKLGYEQTNSTGKNVCGYIDNRSPLTVLVTAHYDHIGMQGGFMPGADNNASGVAGLFYLAEQLKVNRMTGYNYLFVAFSGKEENLQGSAAFAKQMEGSLNAFSCMVHLNMIGRFKNAVRDIYVTGAGTSPTWAQIIPKISLGYNFRIDSCGYTSTDITSFYLKNIPTLQFSTGYHDDYQTEQDVPDRINSAGAIEVLNLVYKTLSELSLTTKPVFTKPQELLPKLKNVKVDMGIMPDFSFQEEGLRIGACLKNKLAATTGFQSGDVIIKIGEYPIYDVDDYVKALKKSSEDRETAIIIKRGKEEYKFFVLLSP
jgi:aminopeptidase YwaD